MENAEEILVIILSSFLALFLLLGIVILVKSIQIINSLKRITDKAEKIVDKAENIGEFFQRTTSSLAIGRLLTQVANAVFKHDEKGGKGGKD